VKIGVERWCHCWDQGWVVSELVLVIDKSRDLVCVSGSPESTCEEGARKVSLVDLFRLGCESCNACYIS